MIASSRLLAGAGALAFLALLRTSSAQVLFQDNFDGGQSAANWVPQLSLSTAPPTDTAANFAFDYSTLGIPAAPRSNGTTIGMNFVVNREGGVLQGISATPLDQHFTGDFILRFDAWLNFVGPLPAGGNGSTQMASFGWGTNGTTVQYSAANHSIMFAASGDGGTQQDYRVYRVAGGAPLAPDTNPGVYAAGDVSTPAASDSRNNVNPYYAPLGGKTAPPAQLSLFPNQSGATSAGTFGMAWRDVTIEKAGDVLTWTVDGLRIVTVPIAGATPGGDNIFFGMFDINATSSADGNDFLNTAVYDNVIVTVPEPSSLSLLGLIAGGVLFVRRRRA